MYDSTVKAMGFDVVRVRYRQQRRDIIRHIILYQLIGISMKEYLFGQHVTLIKKEDQVSFFEDVIEDLRDMDVSRIVGLGITPNQMNIWIIAQRNCEMDLEKILLERRQTEEHQ